MTYELVAADRLNAQQIHDLRTIYEGGYAAEDRAPWNRVYPPQRTTEHPLALVRRDVVTGFAQLRAPSDADYALLRYFMIDPTERGHGLGCRFWRRVAAYASEYGHRWLVWDVVAPDQRAGEWDEHATQPGHITVHERMNGSLVPIGEYEAHDTEDQRRSVAMRLVATPLTDGTETVDARELRRIAMDVCAHRYEYAVEGPGRRPSIDSAHDV